MRRFVIRRRRFPQSIIEKVVVTSDTITVIG